MKIVGWAELLFEFVDSRKQTPFAWGAHDCCLFPADSGIVVCGVDFAQAVRGYSSQQEAEAIIAEYGGMETMVSTLMDRDPIPAAFARRADFVKATLSAGETMGICLGNVCAFAQLGGGVITLPRSVASMAWRVE